MEKNIEENMMMEALECFEFYTEPVSKTELALKTIQYYAEDTVVKTAEPENSKDIVDDVCEIIANINPKDIISAIDEAVKRGFIKKTGDGCLDITDLGFEWCKAQLQKTQSPQKEIPIIEVLA